MRTHPDCSREKLVGWVEQVQRRAAVEEGASYSGEWNMCPGPVAFPFVPVFESYHLAEEYIGEKHQKWEPLIAVKARQDRPLSAQAERTDSALKDLRQQAQEIESQIRALPGAAIRRAKEGKSRRKACSNCGSSISVEHLSTCNCPVCQASFLLTEADVKRRQALEKKLAALLAKKKARREALLKKQYGDAGASETVWVVGGLCAS